MRERGSATVLVLAVVVVALLGALTLAVVVTAVAGRGAAQAAADLGALGGSTVAVRGTGDPCAIAARVVARNGATLDRCATVPGGVVEVAVSLRTWPSGLMARAEARAGPAWMRAADAPSGG